MRYSVFSYLKILIAAGIIFFSLFSCGGEKKEFINTPYDRESIPSMVTDSVTELISDSGVIRYKMLTDKWIVYDNSSDPHWFFPEGLYLEQFDTALNIEATIKADTAWNYTQRKLWKLKGNVFVRNAQDETFASQELYWDDRQGKVYSNEYIEINRPNKLMLRGKGFESNQQMTVYKIFEPGGTDIYVAEDISLSAQEDSSNLTRKIQPDTLKMMVNP